MDFENIIQQTKVNTEEIIKSITPLINIIVLCEMKKGFTSIQAQTELEQLQLLNISAISDFLLKHKYHKN